MSKKAFGKKSWDCYERLTFGLEGTRFMAPINAGVGFLPIMFP